MDTISILIIQLGGRNVEEKIENSWEVSKYDQRQTSANGCEIGSTDGQICRAKKKLQAQFGYATICNQMNRN